MPLILGLAIGIPLPVIIIITLVIVLHIVRSRRRDEPNEKADTEDTLTTIDPNDRSLFVSTFGKNSKKQKKTEGLDRIK